jgi:hypothetical protein
MNIKLQLGFIFSFAILMGGCQSVRSTPTAGPPAQAFIVSEDVYPSGWKSLPCESLLCQSDGSAYEAYLVSKANQPGHLIQEVFRLDSIEDASAKFATYRKNDFQKKDADPESTEFSPPVELQYTSPIADEYYFACGREFGLVCRMIARYRNYFVYFYFDMDDGRGYGLTYSDVEMILHWLDGRVSSLLGIPLPPE